MTVAYFILLDSPQIERMRVGLARDFPPHITVKGRFDAPPSGISDLVGVGKRRLGAFNSEVCELSGPRETSAGIVWYEPHPESVCEQTCVSAHEALMDELEDLGLNRADFVPKEYQRAGYRPHATISFGDVPINKASLVRSVHASVSGWALYQYDGNEATDPARIAYSAAF